MNVLEKDGPPPNFPHKVLVECGALMAKLGCGGNIDHMLWEGNKPVDRLASMAVDQDVHMVMVIIHVVEITDLLAAVWQTLHLKGLSSFLLYFPMYQKKKKCSGNLYYYKKVTLQFGVDRFLKLAHTFLCQNYPSQLLVSVVITINA